MSQDGLTDDEINLYTHRDPVDETYLYTYHLDAIDLESRLPLDVGRHDAAFGSGLGSLDLLPRELLIKMLEMLDIPSLTTFRAVSRHAMQTVNSLYEYGVVSKRCPNVLRAIIALDARAYGIRTLFETLAETLCRWCRYEFGGLIHLYTCERTCESCASYHTNSPLRIQEAARVTGLSHEKVQESYPSILSLPGYYGAKLPEVGDMITVQERLLLFDSLALYGRSPANSKLFGSDSIMKDLLEVLPDNDVQNSRYMGLISAPYLEEAPHEKEKLVANWGYYCAACRCRGESVLQKFTRRGFVQHLLEEGRIIWERKNVSQDEWEILDVPAVVATGHVHRDLRSEGYRAKHEDYQVQVDPD
ncbi:hypothetical protein QQS21_011466 [Conoideocrella luteorostrata]|uniref:F-box domain-containing protein n=1 Tax=Conoideocrella luteorostrata TaxID=1105319 RepID=A0AAJ0CFV2_9HYPO|nr:hypothetical protein QQS21_011466 [Conoideocrella luteorostrata]